MLLIVALPSAVLAEEGVDERDETELWVPSISMFGGFLGFRGTGLVRSSDVTGPAAPNVQSPIRDAASTSDTLVAASFGGGLELMTPRLLDAFGRPRVFAHADVFGAFDAERTLAGEGKPGKFGLPIINRSILQDEVITGQGSRTLAQTQPLNVSAGAGVAFSFDLLGRRIRLKPSVEYMRQEVEVTGIVKRAVARKAPVRDVEFPDQFRFILLKGKRTLESHGLGVGIEFEGDAVRLGPIQSSVFVSGQGYRILGDRKVEFDVVNKDPSVPPGTEGALFTFEREEWEWGARVGIRLRFAPITD